MTDSALVLGHGERVLIVDDEEQLRHFVTRSLERLGYEVESASSGDEARHALIDSSFDLVFTDIMMPGRTDGIDLALAICDQESPPQVLLTSGFSQRTNRRTILEERGLEVLWKPYTLVDLSRAIGQSLARSKA